MKDETGCLHITTRIRPASVHAGMKVGERVSPTGDVWWCVGCGGLFADDVAKKPIAMPTWCTDPGEPATWGVFDTWERKWCPRRGNEEAMGRHAVRLNGALLGAGAGAYRFQPLPLQVPSNEEPAG